MPRYPDLHVPILLHQENNAFSVLARTYDAIKAHAGVAEASKYVSEATKGGYSALLGVTARWVNIDEEDEDQTITRYGTHAYSISRLSNGYEIRIHENAGESWSMSRTVLGTRNDAVKAAESDIRRMMEKAVRNT